MLLIPKMCLMLFCILVCCNIGDKINIYLLLVYYLLICNLHCLFVSLSYLSCLFIKKGSQPLYLISHFKIYTSEIYINHSLSNILRAFTSSYLLFNHLRWILWLIFLFKAWLDHYPRLTRTSYLPPLFLCIQGIIYYTLFDILCFLTSKQRSTS